MRSASSRPRQASAEPSRELLAIIEAELGALLDFLPVPLLVTSESGKILRANRAAVVFLERTTSIIDKPLAVAIGTQSIDVTTTTLRHERTTLRLCALQHQPG